ncbi:threonine--tRNA ligase [Candidatus Dependentiae bacterium]|nr:MAG: threonine--tRNA ligase [Candidatus Dependentiae bacterium]
MEEKVTPLFALRHSAAHLLAQAVTELYPDTQLTIGPVTEHGFFYDFLPQKNFTIDDLPVIEKRMHELAKKNYPITGGQVPKSEAAALYSENKFKQELIDGIAGETVGIYYQGDFFDLCRGGHVERLGEIKHFKLTAVSGSYWRADRSGIALQRITGVAFLTKKDMDDYFQRVEEAQKYDHRTLGPQLDLFSFHEESAGGVFFHPKGTIVFHELLAWSRHLQKKDKYLEIKTPLLNHESLYKTSGHYDNYKENAYEVMVENHPHWIRPMNCPSCVLFFKQKPHSYRELPMRIAEYGLCHRYELSGVLHGLFRVRSFTQDDAHIFCMPDQLEDEIVQVLELTQKLYEPFGFTELKIAVATRPVKSMGTDEMWTNATSSLTKGLDRLSLGYEIKDGEGAFYGPKIEIQIEDRLGRLWQCGTVQVDFNMPHNFKIGVVQSDQSKAEPVIIHRAIYGSIERFMGVLIEHTKGHLPFWLAPVQMTILTITDKQESGAREYQKQLEAAGFRVELDGSSDKISAKIRRSQLSKIPMMLVVGGREIEQGVVTVRRSDGSQESGVSIEALIEKANALKIY